MCQNDGAPCSWCETAARNRESKQTVGKSRGDSVARGESAEKIRAAPTPEASTPGIVTVADLLVRLVAAEHSAAFWRAESDTLVRENDDLRATVAALTAERASNAKAVDAWHHLGPKVELFMEWAQSGDVLDAGRWGGHSVFNGVRTEFVEMRERVATLEARLRDAEQTISALPTFESVDGGVCVNRTAALLALAARASQRGAP